MYENLRELDAVSQDENPKKWHEQQLYIQGLEERYPQVCAQCRPRARDAIKRANYFTRTWNMMISMRKTKGGEYAPVVQGRWWRNCLLRYGQVGRETSVFAQAGWHLLGARMVVMDDSELALGVEKPSNTESFPGAAISCVSQTFGARDVNPHCFVDATPWVFWIILLGVTTVWWNNKLRQKYLDRKPGRMKGTRDYYLLQLLALAIRGVAFRFLQSPHQLASSSGIEHLSNSSNIYRGAHIFMIAFLGFTELISRSLVQLNNRYQVRQLRDEDILPDTPMPRRIAQQQQTVRSQQANATATDTPPAWLRQQPKVFDISSLSSSLDARPTRHIQQAPAFLSPQYQSPMAPPTPPLEDSMEWTPTETSFATSSFQSRNPQQTYNLRPRNTPQKSAPTGPSPFTGLPPRAPSSRMTHPRTLNSTAASVQKPSNISSPSHSLSTTQHWDVDSNASEPDIAATFPDQADSPWSKHGPKKSDFQMAPPKFFLDQERVDTGLEGIFDEVFTLGDDATPSSVRAEGHSQRRQESEDGNAGRGHGAMFGKEYEDSVMKSVVQGEGMDAGIWLVVIVLGLALGLVTAVLIGWDWRGFLAVMRKGGAVATS